tara:strand:- start:275 stop:5536 length:5262 start_codon:yes stop_codon:yes gene_type:complete
MTISFSENLMSSTYKDDFSDSAGYKRILFNPRRPLQARELTQSQTIIQKDMERFGRNIFKEGAMVNPGGITLHPKIEFVKLQPGVLQGPTTTFAESSLAVPGAIFNGLTSGVSAEIITREDGDGTVANPPTLYIMYRSGGSQTAGTSTLKFLPDETIQIDNGSESYKIKANHTTANPSYGQGVRLSVAAGDYFTQGHFCYARPQSIIISKYSNDFTGIVGFNAVQDIVTASDNESLFDNQGQFPNIAAPGADRYRITLTLAVKPVTPDLDSFVFIANIVNSVIVEQATGFNQYNKINDLIAQRTAEESGDYVVDPFYLTYDSGSASTLNAVLSPGKAYVNGHRINRPTRTQISINKATSFAGNTSTGDISSIPSEYGSYVIVSAFVGALPMDSPSGNQKTTFPAVNIYKADNSVLGTCRVRHVDAPAAFGANFRVFIFDVVMTGTNSFRDAVKIGPSTSARSTLVLEGTPAGAVIKEANDNNLFFEVPYKRPKDIAIVDLTVMRKFTGTPSSNSITLTALSGEVFDNTGDWIVMQGGTVTTAGTIGSPGSQTIQITGLPHATNNVEVLAYVKKSSNIAVRSKTISPNQQKTIAISVSGGIGTVDLDQNDIIAVTMIRAGSSSGADVSDQFVVDNGQRDGFYGLGKLIRKSTSGLTGNVYVEFTYYQHGAGVCFAVGSYPGLPAAYGDIPEYIMRDGTVVQLRDVIDFRSAKKADGTFNDTGGATGGVVNELPQNDTLINVRIEHYLPRQDRIVIADDGNILNLEGTPSDIPSLPALPPKTLELYRSSLNGGTINSSDMIVKFIENKGYTMKDIGKIDKRVDLLEESVALSLLELDTNTLEVTDEAGNNRTKSGFLVDNFKDLFHADIDNVEYRASINPKTMTLHPAFTEYNVGLIYDAANSSTRVVGGVVTPDTVLKGDNVYIKHTEIEYITQNVVSRTENVNPFMVSEYFGSITLSPQSDEWKVDQHAAAKIIDGGTRLNTNQAVMFDQSEWGWLGNDIEGLEVGDATTVAGTTTSSSRSFTQRAGNLTVWGFDQTTSSIVNRVVASETIRTSLGSKIIDVVVIPFMRSRRVSFEAVGLRPNAYHFAYFNDRKMDDFVKSTGSFDRINSSRIEYESPNNLTQHPDGPGVLLSNALGVISGTFFIPNNSTTKFRTGNSEFKLLDVTEIIDNGGVPGSSAIASYNASGALQTWQEEILSTRHLTIVGGRVTSTSRRVTGSRIIQPPREDDNRQRDPLAQSFFILQDEGIFTTKIDLYFKTKHATLPVWIELRPLVNGYPASNTIVPGSRKYLSPGDVAISDDASLPTTFTFDEPIYLSGTTEYAVVCICDNTDYLLWTSFMGDFELGSTSRRITKQPFLGSFFKSQNASTWEASQEQDMKFTLYRADFATNIQAIAQLNNADLPLANLSSNPIETNTTAPTSVRVHQRDHNLAVNDKVAISGATATGGVTAAELNVTHDITHIDPTGFKFTLAAGSATSAARGGGSAVLSAKNIQGSTLYPIVQTLNPNNTSMIPKARIYTGYSNVALETPYQAPASGYADIALNRKNYFENPILIANPVKEDTANAIMGLGGVHTGSLQIAMSTQTPFVSPVIDMQRASLVITKNEIDRPAAFSSPLPTGKNVVFDFAAETTPFSGSALSKHITKPVTLTSSAVGLKVMLAGNRPTGSLIDVYYKTGTEDTILTDIDWTLAELEAPVSISDNIYSYKEYRYLIGGDAGDLAAFTTFQVKIVFYANNNSKVPTVKDLRVIALGV